jgi:HAD superfamily hydrolase (TIGR01490 family)
MTDDKTAPLSIFDLDRTLTRRGTWSPFLLFAAKRNAPWRMVFLPAVVLSMVAYKIHLITRKSLKEKMQAFLLGRRIPQAKILALAEQYADMCVANGLYSEGQALMREEQAKGRRVLIASAAHCFYLEPIARRLSAEHVGTKCIWRDGMLLAKIDGDNCYGTAKRDRIIQFMAQRGINREAVHVRFFSDDMSDQPTFDWADEAVAVNPSSRLARHAARRGWCIYNWRKPRGLQASLPWDGQAIEQIEIGIGRLSHAVPVSDFSS